MGQRVWEGSHSRSSQAPLPKGVPRLPLLSWERLALEAGHILGERRLLWDPSGRSGWRWVTHLGSIPSNKGEAYADLLVSQAGLSEPILGHLSETLGPWGSLLHLATGNTKRFPY